MTANNCNVYVKFLYRFSFSFHLKALKERVRGLALLVELSPELFPIYFSLLIENFQHFKNDFVVNTTFNTLKRLHFSCKHNVVHFYFQTSKKKTRGRHMFMIHMNSNLFQAQQQRGDSFSTYEKFFRKTNISYPLTRTRTCAYQGVRNVSFPERFALTLNDDPKSDMRKFISHIFKHLTKKACQT